MKILCSISGIEFNCEHFPGALTSREVSHPVFSIPQKKLLSYTRKWAAGELTTTDSYLLFLAILASSELIQFRVPVSRNEQTNSIVANNMESLVKITAKLNAVTNPNVTFPHYAVTPETKYLTNVNHWISNWEDAYKEFQDGYSRQEDSRKLITREAALERMIKNPHLPISAYASKIAEWAAIAGSFPTYTVKSPFTYLPVSMADYWKEIISRCSRDESLFSVPQIDITDLLEHCENNIPIGTIYSNALFKVLRHAIERQKNFLGLGDLDLSRGKYHILGDNDTVETANIRAMIDSAPDKMPEEKSYPNKLAYLKAKMRYQMAQKFGSEKNTSAFNDNNSPNNNPITNI